MANNYGLKNFRYTAGVPTLNPFFAVVRIGDLNKIMNAKISLADLDIRDGEEKPLWVYFKQHNQQNLLDYCYQLAVEYFSHNGLLNLSQQDEKTRTLLHWAAKCNQNEAVIKSLVNAGASIDDANNSFKVTPLYMAMMEGSAVAAEALIAVGADIHLMAINGAVPLHAAAETGSIDCLRVLLRAGANVDAQCQVGGTALMAAVQHNNILAVKALLAAGANLNLQKTDGATALLIAAQFGYTAIVELLLANDADATLALQSGVTALEAAKTNQHKEIVAALESVAS